MNDMYLYEASKPLEKNFPVKIQAGGKRGSFDIHWHELMEFLYIFDGVHTIFCAGSSYTAKAGELFIVHSNELHAVETQKAGLRLCVRLFPSFFSDIQFDNITFQQVISDDDTIHMLFSQMLEEHRRHLPGYDMELKALAYHFVTYLMRNYRKESFSEEELKRQQRRADRIHAMLQYISAHYKEKLTTARIAEQFYITEYHFCHLFKTETGLSPTGYINRYRIEKAAVFLKNTDQSITDISALVGFEDSNYFARTFKKYMGVSPRQYRKQESE